ncbi:MAG: M48 family metallopeptidase [Candidatus Methylomirabilis sp.]|nr:M48 family metallopeptidase [Deltaproteobacteria bacterium]
MDLSPALVIILGLYLAAAGYRLALELLNIRHLEERWGEVPPGFEGHIDRDFLARSRDYTVENARHGIIEKLAGSLTVLVFVLFLLKPYDRWIASIGGGFIASGALFFMLLIVAETLVSALFAFWRVFRIERKFGFSAMTPGLWAADFAKSLAISSVLALFLISAGLWIITLSPGLWWLWIWLLFLGFTIFMMYVSPYLIEPLFNRFDEVDDPGLRDGIKEVLKKAGIRVGKVLKVDASRRTLHTNAYFTGIGSVKRIVLYDTLLKKLGKEEIISVLAHEAGHWKGRHLLKGLVAMELLSLAALYISYRIIESGLLERAFGFEGASFYALMVLLGFLASMVGVPFGPLFAWLSRRREKRADRFAAEISNDPSSMASALIKLSRDNLSNLHPHPLYAAFHYSHPPVAERVRELRKIRDLRE